MRRFLVVFAVLAALVGGVVGLHPQSASAHRSGCHAVHSCESDSGAYVCGDLGYPCDSAADPSSGGDSGQVDTSGGDTSGGSGDLDCRDFATQPDAQAYFDANGGSPDFNFNNLDANHNGVACEGPDAGEGGVGGVDTSVDTSTDTSGAAADASTVDTSTGGVTTMPVTGVGPMRGSGLPTLPMLIVLATLMGFLGLSFNRQR